MAKKKSEPTEVEKPATPRKSAAKKPASGVAVEAASPSSGKAPARAAAKTPVARKPRVGGAAAPLIDTNLAASTAASLLLARRKGRDQVDTSISIEQIKSDLSKPHAAVAGDVISQHAESAGARRPSLPTDPRGGSHSQTVGHSAERTFVPRRTGG
jgi:hypothetical protein